MPLEWNLDALEFDPNFNSGEIKKNRMQSSVEQSINESGLALDELMADSALFDSGLGKLSRTVSGGAILEQVRDLVKAERVWIEEGHSVSKLRAHIGALGSVLQRMAS